MATVSFEPPSSDNTLNQWFTHLYTINWEVIIYALILFFAVFTRFYELGERVMSHDESLHTVYSNNLYERGDFRHSPLMHGPVLFHMTAFSYFLFGVDDFTARIYPAVLGVILVMFPILFRHWLGKVGAMLASIMLLVSPLLTYYSRYIRHDIPSILSGMIMFYAAMMYISGPGRQQRRAHWLYILAAAMLWNLGSKETAFIYIAIFGAFLTLYWLVRMAQHFLDLDGKQIFEILIVGILLGGVAALAMMVVFSVSMAEWPTLDSRLDYMGEQFNFLVAMQPIQLEFSSFLSWTGLVITSLLAVLIGPALWVYRRMEIKLSLLDIWMGVVAVALVGVVSSLLYSNTVDTSTGIEIVTNTAGVAWTVGLITGISFALLYAALRIKPVRSFRRHLMTLLILMLAVCTILLVVEELSHAPSRGDETAPLPVPGQETDTEIVESEFSAGPLILVWVLGSGVIVGLLWSKRAGLWDVLTLFPEFDVLMVMGSLILPWLTAGFIVATRSNPADYNEIGVTFQGLAGLLPLTGPEQIGRFVVGFIAWIPMMAVATIAGMLWNWRRWIVSWLVFHALFAFFFTTIFTNIEGLATGMIYSLQYWLEQQGVRRGSQPQYYYLLVILPFYELLPIIGSILAMVTGIIVFWRRQLQYDESKPLVQAVSDQELEEAEPAPKTRWRLEHVPFFLFVSWWAILNLVGYTLAGEKMPWLGTHMTVPMILLSAWYFGRIIQQIEWHKFMNRGWIYLLLLPFLFIGLFQIITPYWTGKTPFSGTQQVQLTWTYNWLAMVVVTGGVLYGVIRLSQHTGWPYLRRMIALVAFAMMAIITFRITWMSSFIHYDEATEFLVYAHGGPANKRVTEELAELSFRITDGMDISVLYDDKFSWPGSWYMRDFEGATFIGSTTPSQQQLDNAVAVIVGDSNRSKIEPLVEDSFQRFDHIRMWWPIQDYFGLNPDRVANLVDFSDPQVGQLRKGIFDIWWQRDYSTYANAKNKSITLTNWPVSDRMHLYVRKDYAAQVWPYGIGDATAVNPFNQVEINTCVANRENSLATLLFDTSQHQLMTPVDITVAPDGNVYIAEDAGRRISVFSSDGEYLSSFGQPGTAAQDGAFFERPHSVAVNDDGEIFVVDTWNYLIRRFDPDLNPIRSWGQPTKAGFEAMIQPTDGFWGPRDVALDQEGNVYISDTGNKRIRVYTPDGVWLWDIGSGGGGEGQLNEPAGVIVHPEDGRVFIADTWNRRVAVFNADGTFNANYPVRGWYEDLGNRPYLAIDAERDLLYVTDPDAGRILIYDTDGECIASFGSLDREAPGGDEFHTIGGITTDAAGNVYIVDMGLGRVLKFDPYERPPEPIKQDAELILPPVINQQNGFNEQQVPDFLRGLGNSEENVPLFEVDDGEEGEVTLEVDPSE